MRQARGNCSDGTLRAHVSPLHSLQWAASFCVAMSLTIPVWAQRYDLDRGIGSKIHGCMHVAVAPGIKPDDVNIVYVKHNSIKVEIRGSDDSLLCMGFYAPARRKTAELANFRFQDGTVWKFDEIAKRSNLRALADPEDPKRLNEGAPASVSRPSVAYASTQFVSAALQKASFSSDGSPVFYRVAMTKCVVDGKVLYTDGNCPGGPSAKSTAKPGATTSTAAPSIPTLQRGIWKATVNKNGKVTSEELCHDPMTAFKRMISESEQLRSAGCRLNTTSKGTGNYNLVVDCPADWVSPDGSQSVRKGKIDIDINVPSPHQFSGVVVSTRDNVRMSVQASRIGSCN